MERFFWLLETDWPDAIDCGSITLPAYLFSLNTTIRHVRLELLRTKVRMFYATTTNLDSVALMNRS